MEPCLHNRAKPVPRRPKRSRLSLACERCRLKKRKCNSETPCTHCIKDGIICSKQRRKRVLKHTTPSEESVEFYEYQIHRLSAAVSELYKRLYQTGSLRTDSDGSHWPEHPKGVHVIVDLLNLPDVDCPFTPSDRANLGDDKLDASASEHLEGSSVTSSLRPRLDHYSPFTSANADERRQNSYDSPNSSFLSRSPTVSDLSDSPSLYDGDELPDWYGLPDGSLFVDESFDPLPFAQSDRFADDLPLGDEPLLVAGDEWSCGHGGGTNPTAFTGPFDVPLMRRLPISNGLFDRECSV